MEDAKPDPFTQAFRGELMQGLGMGSAAGLVSGIIGTAGGGPPAGLAAFAGSTLAGGVNALPKAVEAGEKAHLEANPADSDAFAKAAQDAKEALDEHAYQRDFEARVAELEAELAPDAIPNDMKGSLNEEFTLDPDPAETQDQSPSEDSVPPETQGNLDDTLPAHPEYAPDTAETESGEEPASAESGDPGMPTDAEIEAVVGAIEAMDDGTKDFAGKAEAAYEQYASSLHAGAAEPNSHSGNADEGSAPDAGHDPASPDLSEIVGEGAPGGWGESLDPLDNPEDVDISVGGEAADNPDPDPGDTHGGA